MFLKTYPRPASNDSSGGCLEDGVWLHHEEDGRSRVEEVGADSGSCAQMPIDADALKLWEDHGDVSTKQGQRQVHSNDVEHFPQVAETKIKKYVNKKGFFS